MKTLFVTLILLIFFGKLFSQDLIITNLGDTLNCKITSEKGEYLNFTFVHEEELRKTLLPKSEVKQYTFNFFNVPEIPAEIERNKQDYHHFRLSLNGGYSFRLGKIAESIPDDFNYYAKELKKGNHFAVDATYFTAETIGFGVKYAQFYSDNELPNVSADVDGDGLMDSGKMRDDISIYYIGPILSTRLLSSDKKNALFTNVGIGYLGYHNMGELAGFEFELKGAAVGFVGDLGYQVGLSDDLSLGITFSYTLGTLTKIQRGIDGSFTTYELDKDEYENLGRIDLSLGLIFHK